MGLSLSFKRNSRASIIDITYLRWAGVLVPFSSPALGFALGPGPIFGPGPWFCCYFAVSVIGWAGAYYYLIGLPAPFCYSG
jgi:hypothetical protein